MCRPLGMTSIAYRDEITGNPEALARSSKLVESSVAAGDRLAPLNRLTANPLGNFSFQFATYSISDCIETVAGPEVGRISASPQSLVKALRKKCGLSTGDPEERTIALMQELIFSYDAQRERVKFELWDALARYAESGTAAIDPGSIAGAIAIRGGLTMLRRGDDDELDRLLIELESERANLAQSISEILK
jgi:hypothetical protein